MVTRIAFAVAAFTLTACAQSKPTASALRSEDAAAPAAELTETQKAIASAYATLVKNEDSEATLDVSYLKTKESGFGKALLADMGELIGEAELDGGLELKALYPEDGDADARLAELAGKIRDASGESAFYCSRFAQQPQNDSECVYRVVDLLSALSSDSEARVYFGYFSANDYGSYRAAVVYIARPTGDIDAEVTVQRALFDIVHEL